MKKIWMLLAAALAVSVIISCGSSYVGTGGTGTPRFAYVTNYASDIISIYAIDPATGKWRYISRQISQVYPISVVVSPSGKYAYSINNSTDDLDQYTIDQTTGKLSFNPQGVAGPDTGSQPRCIAIDPTERFVYVANYGSNNISYYTINQTNGRLSNGTTVPAGTNPIYVAIDPSGRFAYVKYEGAYDVSTFRINPTSGLLTAGPNAPGYGGWNIIADPSGKFVYSADGQGFDTLSVYGINQTTGDLIQQQKIVTGAYPNSMSFLVEAR